MELIVCSQSRILDRVKKWYMSSILSYTQIHFLNKKSINMKYFLEWTLYVKTVLKKNVYLYMDQSYSYSIEKRDKHNETMFNDKAVVGHLQVTTKS